MLFFTFCCLWLLVSIKTFTLTNENFIINRPVLLYRKTIPLKNIESIREKEYEISPSSKGKQINMYNGLQCEIKLLSCKKIEFNSLNVSEYYQFKNALNSLLRNEKIDKLNHLPKPVSNRSLAFLIVFCVLLTIGLLYSLILELFLFFAI